MARGRRLTDEERAILGAIGASLILTDGDKRVFDKHFWLDPDGEGSAMSAEYMGTLLGKRPETVEACRRRLLKAGLLERSERRGRRTLWWWRFPYQLPQRAGGSPRVEDFAKARDALDAIIAPLLDGLRSQGIPERGTGAPNLEGYRESRSEPLDSPRHTKQGKPGRSTGFERARSSASFRGEGGKGGGATPLTACETSPLRSAQIPDGGDAGQERVAPRATAAHRAGAVVSRGGDQMIAGNGGGNQFDEWAQRNSRNAP